MKPKTTTPLQKLTEKFDKQLLFLLSLELSSHSLPKGRQGANNAR